MAEHALIDAGDGDQIQWHDATLCMVIDTATAQPLRFGAAFAATGTLNEALAFVTERPMETLRLAIVPLRVIRPWKFTPPKKD